MNTDRLSSIAANDGKDLTRDVARHLRGSEEDVGGSDFLRLRGAFHRRLAAECRDVVGFLVRWIERRPCRARSDRVDADPLGTNWLERAFVKAWIPPLVIE